MSNNGDIREYEPLKGAGLLRSCVAALQTFCILAALVVILVFERMGLLRDPITNAVDELNKGCTLGIAFMALFLSMLAALMYMAFKG